MRTDETIFLIFYWNGKIIFYNIVNSVEISVDKLENKIFGSHGKICSTLHKVHCATLFFQ